MDIPLSEQIRYGLMEVKAEREGKHKMLTVKEFFNEFDKD
jgi:hypothetical protein